MEEAVRRRFLKIEAILQESKWIAWSRRMSTSKRWMRKIRRRVKIEMRELAGLRRFSRQLGERLDRYAKETDQKIAALIDSHQRTEARWAFVGSGTSRGTQPFLRLL